MDLSIKPYHKNTFQYGGILIKNASVKTCIKEIQNLQLDLKSIEVYPIPGTTANSIWGVFLIPSTKINKDIIGKNQLCQQVNANLFIPEKSIVFPALTTIELEKLFANSKHIIHPEFGLVELKDQINFQDIIITPTQKSFIVTTPKASVLIPKQIKSYQVNPVSAEEAMKNLEDNIFPKKEKMPNEPLNIFEKGKLAFYKLVLGKSGQSNTSNITNEKPGILSAIQKMIGSKSGIITKWFDKMEQDFDNLEERNKKQIDKLMDMFKNNPELALKFAVPLDETGTNRGGLNKGLLDISAKWFDFSLFSNSSNSGGGTIDLGDRYFELQQQYNRTAEDLIAKKEYQKAAFVYFKLLKNHYKAAETLAEGKLYQEAASIHLKHTGQKQKAAEYYEKGNMTSEAIDIYKELNQNEKVGDLYVSINKRKEADIFYQKVIDNYKSTNQYVKASLIYKNKINDEQAGQSLLLSGWRANKDAFNCLNNYFSNIHDTKQLLKEINTVYQTDITYINRNIFLQAIKYEYKKGNELAEPIKEIAYEIIAQEIKHNPTIVSELKNFNNNSKQLIKDTLRYTLNNRVKSSKPL